MKEKAVGWSGIFKKTTCKFCNKQTPHQIVQSQKKLAIGSLNLMGTGPRDLAKQCSECNNLVTLTSTEKKEAKKLRYYIKPQQKEIVDRVAMKKEKKYPILTDERRKEIIADNRKEGTLSAVIGTFLGFVVIPFNVWIGLGIIGFSIIGGLYATYEDPEAKHRGIIDKYGFQKKL